MLWWAIYTALIGLTMLVVWSRQGPRRAILAGVLLSLLVPEWLRWYPLGEVPAEGSINSAGVWVNVRVAVAVIGGILYLLHPKSTYNFKLIWTDWAMGGMMLTHLVSDLLAMGLDWSIPLRIYGEWYLPYAMGRIAIQTISDVRWSVPIAVIVAVVLAAFSVAECIGELEPNPSEMLAGFTPRPLENTPHDADRMGFKRAYGPAMHPIYFATMQFLLLPWMIYAASRSLKSQNEPIWWVGMPLVCALGIAGPISRAPFVGMVILAYVMVMVFSPKRRKAMAIAGAVVVLGLAVGWDVVVGRLERSLGQDQQTIVARGADGRYKKWTGTRHRLMLFEEYAPALKQAGLFGWGTQRMTGFPAQVPRSSDSRQDAEIIEAPPPTPLTAAQRRLPVEMRPTYVRDMHRPMREADIATLDNAFLLYTLRFGVLGLCFFIALNATAAWNFIRLSMKPKSAGRIWIAASAGTVVAMGFVLLTVWMPQDFGFFYLFLIGSSAGLIVEKERPLLAHEEDQQPSKKKSHRRRRRRVRVRKEEAWPGDDPAATKPLSEMESAPVAISSDETPTA